jgi:hypothetical protein
MSFPPNTVALHLFLTLEVVLVRRFLKPAVLPPALTRLLTFRLGTMALPISGSGIGIIHLATMQAFTTGIFSHGPHALREEIPSAKENPPAKQMGPKKSGRRDYI